MDTRNAQKGVMPRACLNCRLRKIRCNRTVPCGSCTASGLDCPLKGDAPPQRIQTKPTFSEKHLERINERLASIEYAIDKLGVSNNCSPSPNSAQSILSTPNIISTHDGHVECTGTLLEGDSSFGSQALLASQVSELTDLSARHPHAVGEELRRLQAIAQDRTAPQNVGITSGLAPHPQPSDFSANLLPSELVLRLLRTIKGRETPIFLFYGINDFAQIDDLCRRMYFPLEPISPADCTFFNGIISAIIYDLDLVSDHGFSQAELDHLRLVCQAKFHAGLETYEVMTVPTWQHTMSLSIAMIQAQRAAKLARQWAFTSAAARHCLALGYHRADRLAKVSPLEAQRIRRMFWTVYTSDKTLSLRLGRPSIIQDYDVDVGRYVVSDDPEKMAWDSADILFIEFSRIQGLIFEKLYSAGARTLGGPEKQQIVTELSVMLEQWHSGWQQIDVSNVSDRQAFEDIFGPTTVIYYSVLTLLHRGASASNSTSDIPTGCFEAAHQGLKAHLDYYSQIELTASRALSYYTVWILYYISFTPFVITFLHCIATCSADDIRLLEAVLGTLEKFRPSFAYSQRQYKLCNALFRTAKAFIDSQDEPAGSAGDRIFREDVVVLPLQHPFAEDWPNGDYGLDLGDAASVWASIPESENQGLRQSHGGVSLGNMSFVIDNQVGEPYL